MGAKIYALGGITNVFLAADFVSVTAEDASAWDALTPRVIAAIHEHFDA